MNSVRFKYHLVNLRISGTFPSIIDMSIACKPKLLICNGKYEM